MLDDLLLGMSYPEIEVFRITYWIKVSERVD